MSARSFLGRITVLMKHDFGLVSLKWVLSMLFRCLIVLVHWHLPWVVSVGHLWIMSLRYLSGRSYILTWLPLWLLLSVTWSLPSLLKHLFFPLLLQVNLLLRILFMSENQSTFIVHLQALALQFIFLHFVLILLGRVANEWAWSFWLSILLLFFWRFRLGRLPL